jgi:MATE family multidrug resistance protein
MPSVPEAREIHPFERRPHHTLMALSLPVMLSLIVQPMAGVVDTAFVGRLGAASAAALGAATSLIAGVLWIFNFLGVGTQTEVAHAIGQKRIQATREVASLAVIVALALGAAVALIFSLGVVPAMEWMSDDPVAVEQAVVYCEILLLGFPASLSLIAAFGALRGLQDMRTPMWIAGGMTALNVLLDAVLIFGWGPIPAFGIAGAAWATVVSQIAAATWSVFAMVRRVGWTWRVQLADARAFLVIGRDMVLRTAALLLFMTLGMRAALHAGTSAGAAHQAMRQMWMLLAFLLDAYASAAQSLIAYFLGAGLRDTARQVAAVSLGWGLATGVLVSALMLAIEPAVARLLVPPEALALFASSWPILALAQPLNAVSFVTDGIHWGAKDYAYLRNAMGFSTAVGIGLLLCIDLSSKAALEGVWYVTAAWIAIRAMLGCLRVWPGFGRAPLRASH